MPISDLFTMVCVSNAFAYKGIEDLIAATNILQHQIPRWRLLLVGRGTEKFSRYYESLHWHIHGMGERSDVTGILKTADLFILPSHGEGSSNALLEAMAAGVPVIATDVGGNRDAIIDGHTGLLVPVKDPERLAAAIVNCWLFPIERAERARLAQLDVAIRFSFDHMVDEYEELYRGLDCY